MQLIILLYYSVYPSMQLSKHRGYKWGHIGTCTLVVWLVRNVCLVEPCSSSGLAEVDVEHTSERHFQQLIIEFPLHMMYFYTHEAAMLFAFKYYTLSVPATQ